jgi:heat shock protein HtpX
MEAGNLFAQQEANRRRSQWLVVGVVLFFMWVGFGGDFALGLLTADAPPEAYHHVVPWIGLVTSLAAGVLCWIAWRTGPRRVLWAAGAWEIVSPETAQLKQLDNVVEEMAIAAGLPKPKVYVVDDPDPNAFATGHDGSDASIAVTQGLLDALSRDELQGVVAHEMAHVRNLDVRLMTLLAALVGAIALLHDGFGRMLRSGVRVGGGGRGGRGSGKGGGNPLGLLLLVLWLLTLVVAPIVSRLLAMSVSRKRELLADATAAQLTRNPLALATALEKLDGARGATRRIAQGAAHLCIVDPAERRLAEREGFLGDLFASHPPIRQRVAQLRAMAYAEQKRAGEAGVVA